MAGIGAFTSLLHEDDTTPAKNFNAIFEKALREYKVESVKDLKEDNKDDFYNRLHEMLSDIPPLVQETEHIDEEESDYQVFFKKKLAKYNIKSPNSLDAEKKKKFFKEIEDEWTGDSEAKNESLSSFTKDSILEKYVMFRDKVFSKVSESFDNTLKVYYDMYMRLPNDENQIALTYYFKECLELNYDSYSEEEKVKADKILKK